MELVDELREEIESNVWSHWGIDELPSEEDVYVWVDMLLKLHLDMSPQRFNYTYGFLAEFKGFSKAGDCLCYIVFNKDAHIFPWSMAEYEDRRLYSALAKFEGLIKTGYR